MSMDSPQGGLALESISVVTPGHDSRDIPLHELKPDTQPHDSQRVALQDLNPRRNDAQPVPQSQYVQLNLNVICLLIVVVD